MPRENRSYADSRLALGAPAIHARCPASRPSSACVSTRSRVGSFERVTAPPYDVISPEEQRRFLDASPYNVIRLDLGRDEPATAPTVDKRYGRRRRGPRRRGASRASLVPTERTAYFPYEMRFSLHGRRRRRPRPGLRGRARRTGAATIVPHERTMTGPVEDRLRLMRAVRANLSCIYAVFRGPSRPLAAWLEDATARPSRPRATTDEDGVEHRSG